MYSYCDIYEHQPKTKTDELPIIELTKQLIEIIVFIQQPLANKIASLCNPVVDKDRLKEALTQAIQDFDTSAVAVVSSASTRQVTLRHYMQHSKNWKQS